MQHDKNTLQYSQVENTRNTIPACSPLNQEHRIAVRTGRVQASLTTIPCFRAQRLDPDFLARRTTFSIHPLAVAPNCQLSHCPSIPSAQTKLPCWLCKELACSSYRPKALSMPYYVAPSNSTTSWTWPCTSSNKSSSTDHSPTASVSLTLSLLIVPILNGDTCHSLGVHLLGCWSKAAEPLSCVLTVLRSTELFHP